MLGLYAFTIAVASISVFVSLGAYIFYIHYDREQKPSRLLQLITLLILSDGMSSMCFVVWAILDLYETEKDADQWCRIFLPFPNFFFLVGFGLMMLIAHRFKEINQIHADRKMTELPLWVVPFAAIVCILPLVISNCLGHGTEVSELIESNREHNRRLCFFSSERKAFAVNAVCFHLPIVGTVVYNIYAYFKGVHALRESPYTVMERQVNRARKYVFVLLAVWIPSILVNLYHTFFIRQGEDPYMLVQLLIILTSMQGILNSIVYIWGHRPFRLWLKQKLGIRPLVDCDGDDTETLLTTQAVFNETTLQSSLKGSDLQQHQLQRQLTTGDGNYSRIESGEKAVRFGKENDICVFSEPELYANEEDAAVAEGPGDTRSNSRSITSVWRGRMRSLLRLGAQN